MIGLLPLGWVGYVGLPVYTLLGPGFVADYDYEHHMVSVQLSHGGGVMRFFEEVVWL